MEDSHTDIEVSEAPREYSYDEMWVKVFLAVKSAKKSKEITGLRMPHITGAIMSHYESKPLLFSDDALVSTVASCVKYYDDRANDPDIIRLLGDGSCL